MTEAVVILIVAAGVDYQVWFCGLDLQWNPFIVATLGEQNFGRYIEVAFIEGLFCTQTVHLGPGCLAVIQRWPLFRGGR